MGFLDSVLETRTKAATDDFWYQSISSSMPSKAGVPVSDETAMRCTAVYACAKVLSESTSSLPIHLFKRKERGRDKATDHWGYNLMHRQTGPRTPAHQWVETAVFHMAITGNHYSLIAWNNKGGVDQLFPLNPSRVTVEDTGRGLRYKYRDNKGKEHFYPEAQVLHIPAFSWDGITGVSPIAFNRETIGLTIATEEFGARFFSNNANLGTVFTQPEGTRLSSEQKDKLKEDLSAAYASVSKSHKPFVTPPGVDVKKVSIPPDDAQWLDSRKLNKAEIASIFRVPLFMIQEHEKNTSWGTGIEHMNLGFIQHTLRPWMVRIEQMVSLKLLVGTDRDSHYYEFLPEALMRGDMKSSGEYFQIMIQNQVMTPNEVREKMNMNPLDGGDEVIKHENIFGKSQDPPAKETDAEEKSACNCNHCAAMKVGGDKAAKALPRPHNKCARAEPDPELDHPRMSIQRSYRRVIRDAMARVIRRERNDIMAGVGKMVRKRTKRTNRSTDDVAEWIAEFYTRHEEFTREQITPAFTALAEAIGAEAMREIEQSWEWNDELEQWLEDYITAFANRHSNQSRGQLLQLIEELEDDQDIDADESVILDALGERFEEWEAGLDGARPRDDKIGWRESVRLGQGFSAAVFFAAGVATLVWRATGSETCPYCMSLNGRSVGPGEVFLAAGASFAPGDSKPLNPRSDIGHPPCHAGCDCIVVPGG